MNINKKIDSRGFTIVELLIVIVVIAILAAITIVAYNGIQQRSHTTAQKTTAENVAKKVEAYNAIQNAYPTYNSSTPTVTTQLAGVTDSSLAGSGISLGTPNATSADTLTQLKLCNTGAAPTSGSVPTGYVVYIWDSTLTAPGLNPVQAGGTASIVNGASGIANTVSGAGANGANCVIAA